MRTTKIIATVLLAAMCLPLSAQSEAGLLVSAEAEKQVNKKLSFGIEAEMRTRNNLKTTRTTGRTITTSRQEL